MTGSDQKVETGDRELVLTRTFNAPRALVFEAYSSCEHLSHWWGPRAWPMVECSMDFRVGGVWHYCLRGPNEGDAAWGRAVFDEIVEPERIRYTDAFADADGNVDERLPQTNTRVEFGDADGKTRLTLRTTYASPADLQQVLDMGMVAGITETLDRLDEHLLERVASGA